MFTHEDNRRTLIEWATGEFKVAKVLIAKEDCVVGDHWHRNKDETFLLLSGDGKFWRGDTIWMPNKDPKAVNVLHVPRGTYHRFELAKGSVLLGVGTEAFDPKDEISGHPPRRVICILCDRPYDKPDRRDGASAVWIPEDACFECGQPLPGKIIEGRT